MEVRMKRLFCVSGFLLAAAGVGFAAPITFTGLLSGANENPMSGSPGTGSAVVTYDAATHMLSVNVLFSGLETGTTASHIHCCVLPDGNAAVATTVPTFAGFPLGVTSGSYMNTLDLSLASSFNPAFVTAQGGTVAGAEAAFATGLEGGMTYLNIHTMSFPAGEVRAFLEPVPEPASAMLALTALAGLWLMRRKRARG
jgi:MYXO-CTERM domain-containing protein